jgi:hypothetical protein
MSILQKKLSFIFILVLFMQGLHAQSIPIPMNVQPAYKKGTRSTEGRPGNNYWQNTASYSIHVGFDPATRILSGSEDIDYVNNSPDTLRPIVFKLYPNLYKKGEVRTMKVRPEDLTDGVKISSLSVNGNSYDTAKLSIDGTNMMVTKNPLAPKSHMHFHITWSYILNKTSHIRTGEVEPGADFVAYFFPRIAVYDDIDGWNTYQYNGMQEFYNDFCSFQVDVTVPGQYMVWATGDLQNCGEVFAPKYCERILAAGMHDEVTTIIDSTDLLAGNITRQQTSNTWKFTANDVTDFVFAVSDHYLWKASSVIVDSATKRRTRVDAVFNAKHRDYFEVVDFARSTVWAMSHVFPKWPYPYPHETVFDGLDQMEYPMMVNDNPLPDRADAIELTDHEIFHTMFPFYMGINETKYAWMDEGWATIGEWVISPIIDTSIIDEYGVGGYQSQAGKETDLPMISLSTEEGRSYFVNSYPKPGLVYFYLRDLLGETLFNKAMHYYIDQWHGKHPIPYDFFNCINTGSGKNLNWFWKKWFYETAVPDLAITEVKKVTGGYNLILDSKGDMPVPVDITLTLASGEIQKIHRSAAVWEKSKRLLVFFPTKSAITAATLGSTYVPDVNKKDNSWKSK